MGSSCLIVGIVVLVLARKFCRRRVIVKETKLTEEDPQKDMAVGPLFTEQALPTSDVMVAGGVDGTMPAFMTEVKIEEKKID